MVCPAYPHYDAKPVAQLLDIFCVPAGLLRSRCQCSSQTVYESLSLSLPGLSLDGKAFYELGHVLHDA